MQIIDYGLGTWWQVVETFVVSFELLVTEIGLMEAAATAGIRAFATLSVKNTICIVYETIVYDSVLLSLLLLRHVIISGSSCRLDTVKVLVVLVKFLFILNSLV